MTLRRSSIRRKLELSSSTWRPTLLRHTLIDYDTVSSQYEVTTYKAVDLSNWSLLIQRDYSAPIPSLASKRASILYTHIPLNQGYTYINDFVAYYKFSEISGPPSSTGFTYTQYNNNYIYLLFPGTGLCRHAEF